MSETNFEQSATQAAAFQKIWMDSLSKMMQAAFTFNPNGPPPEVLKQMRSGIFQALAQSWDEFLRSPQFLETMKQWMENAISFRKMTNDLMANVRNEMQAPSRDDIGNILLAVRHLEKRVLDRIEVIETQLARGNGNGGPAKHGARKSAGGSTSRARKPSVTSKTTKPNATK
jgi:hypothetical protein